MIDENLFALDSYNYSLPKELIAQYPTKKRDNSRLLCFKRQNNQISHHKFYELVDMLTENDVLVLNNTKVIPARFRAESSEMRDEMNNNLISELSSLISFNVGGGIVADSDPQAELEECKIKAKGIIEAFKSTFSKQI